MIRFFRSPRLLVVILIVAAIAASSVSLRGVDQPAKHATKPRNLAIFVFEGVQIIDYTAPWEVFGHAHPNDDHAFEIYTVAPKAGPITTAMGMSVNPKYTFANAPKADVLVLPGGNVKPHMDDPQVKRWIQETTRNAEIVLSVCNGAFFLGRAGLLDGLEATTFAGLIDELQQAAPKARVVRDRRYVDNGKIITSAGLSSGIDGALHVIERLFGKGQAQVAATALEYDWRPDGGYVRAMLADRYLSGAYRAIRQFQRTVVLHEGTRDWWETRWMIDSELSPKEAIARFEKEVPPAPGWSRDGAAAATGTDVARTVWRHRDAQGQAWTATATFARGNDKGRLVASAVVARDGSSVSSK
ncbi:MAG TPA: DJ-1/PfpI family protein [Thermoanaerobaculia bacterium]|nr:DJ-1/PfpI family protein [Thermoanaerobaculia bacterium]